MPRNQIKNYYLKEMQGEKKHKREKSKRRHKTDITSIYSRSKKKIAYSFQVHSKFMIHSRIAHMRTSQTHTVCRETNKLHISIYIFSLEKRKRKKGNDEKRNRTTCIVYY